MKKGIPKAVGWLIVLMVLALIGHLSYKSKTKNPVTKVVRKSASTMPAQDENIKILMDNGLLERINPQMNEAFINPAIWLRLDYQTKENVSRTMAFYCGQKKGTDLNWVDIKDYQSGKKLAKYSEVLGFKIY